MVTISFVKFPTSKILFALSQMQLGQKHLRSQKGILKHKLMGSGAGNGFSIWPDWNVYALLVHWESENDSKDFFDNSDFWKKYTLNAESYFTIYALPTKSVGTWDGENTFKDHIVKPSVGRIAVLTRATIKKRFIPYFWSKVPSASRNVPDMPGHIFSKGVGELPLFLQATVSIWESKEAMMDYAYRHKDHVEMIKMTKEKGWYSEEMFTEFQLVKIVGKIF